MNIAILLALLAATCSHSDEPDPVDRWRPLVGEHFPAAEVSRALCVIGHESGGDPDATFDEWLHWWEQHPDVMHLSDWPRPPRTTQLGRGGDSRYSVGLFQINVGNLAGNRIAGLAGWIPRTIPASVAGPRHGAPWREYRFTIAEAHAVLLVPVNNVAAAAAIWRHSGWLPAWAADQKACGL